MLTCPFLGQDKWVVQLKEAATAAETAEFDGLLAELETEVERLNDAQCRRCEDTVTRLDKAMASLDKALGAVRAGSDAIRQLVELKGETLANFVCPYLPSSPLFFHASLIDSDVDCHNDIINHGYSFDDR